MSGVPDGTVWILAVLVAALFVWFFWTTGASLLRYARRLITTIQDWPEIRRAMTEAEAQSGGRYPLWLRAVRVLLVLAMIGLVAVIVWRKIASI